MTMRVYAVRADGTTETIRERREFRDTDRQSPGPVNPPCICPHCRRTEQSGR
ncbi:hypothetical protein [Streptomyces sp. TRM64462]|uniref:hypothetical protein n=1 Tax=Streptomyces sp. TRM64462 TaxID=2741726 RepID=UPI001585F7C0|nr:hypothetical protein [Streptomyces sp. TRM64462]